jgi:hypothetical protein
MTALVAAISIPWEHGTRPPPTIMAGLVPAIWIPLGTAADPERD